MASNDTPSSDASDVFLGDAINIATRSVHTRLNKLILLRLPLAIPPRADGPSAYTQGILHIAPLYISFESLWHAALHAHESDSPARESSEPSATGSHTPRPVFPFRSHSSEHSSHGPKPSPRIHAILNQLFIPGLLRSARLRSDLRSLTGWSDAALQSRLEEAATTGRLGDMVSHIRRSAEKLPHVLLAYAWVLYMALFSGGRFIRATLESAGAASHGFWTADRPEKKQTALPVHGPLDFFHFPTPQDGEDLKHEFKQRLADLGPLLTEDEREDIVKEAICIFENLILVINQLDDACHTRLADLNSVDASVLSPRSAAFRIRDSVIVTKERGYRAARRSQSQSQPEGEERVPGIDKQEEEDKGSSRPENAPENEPQNEEEEEEEALPKADKQKSCHTVQLASASPRVERDDPFSARLRRRSSGRTNTRSDSSAAEPDLAERLARAMRFDPRLPVPERTTAPSSLRATGTAGQDEDGDGNGSDGEGSPPPRHRSDSTLARGIQVASALGLAVAVAVAYSRG